MVSFLRCWCWKLWNVVLGCCNLMKLCSGLCIVLCMLLSFLIIVKL